MNVQAHLLTITPDQLKQFEVDKHAIQSSLTDTFIMLDQLSALIVVIEEFTEQASDEVTQKVARLAGLGEHVCKELRDSIPIIQSNLNALSPLESIKA